MTQVDYEKHAKIFLKNIDVEFANCNETNPYHSACEYVAKESDFREKDPVEVER